MNEQNKAASESLPLLPTMPIEPGARKLALSVVLVSIAIFLTFASFAKVPLIQVNAFIPIYESALIITDLITAVLLFGHFSILRTRALLVLACGYVFTALITIPHALTFPGLFSATGLLGAGKQSTAWIYAFWHVGFSLCVIAYSLLNNRENEKPYLIRHPHLAVMSGIAVVVVAVGGFSLLATTYHDSLPAILVSGHYSLAGHVVLISTWIFSGIALAVLWQHRSRSMLDLWLLVVMCAWVCDIALSAVLNAGRYDVGWYAGRIYGLVAGSCVLIVLLLESNKLYARLVGTHQDVLQRTADLQRLNAQNEDRATQYAHALEELHYKEEEVRAVVQNIVDCVITIDSYGIVRSANPAVEKVFGYVEGELIGLNISTLIPRFERHDDSFIRLNAGIGKIAGANNEVEGVHKDGRHIPLEMAINEFVIHDERLSIGTFRDISERKLFITELKQARLYAEKANLAKSTFLSSMSHELRTPLNAILGFSQILGSDNFPVASEEKRKEFANHIVKSGKHLLELINDVLDLTKVESGNLSISLEPVSLKEILDNCQQMIAPMAANRDIRLLFSVEDNQYVFADRTRLKQVLLNLLSNAVKYNRNGGTVILSCLVQPFERIRVTIQDNGAGLDSNQIKQLFQPFNRLGQESGGEEGTGIGLVVTKRLVELMGGEIGVTSTVGVGSVFWLELKSAAAPHALGDKDTVKPNVSVTVPSPIKQTAASVRTILYVEDNPANMILIQEIVGFRPDLRLITALDGMAGIEMARTHHPAMILMDINLPGMSGNEAMLILQTDPATTHIPVVALSANAMAQDIAKSMSAGFFRYLTKPVNIEEFFEVLDSALDFSDKVQSERSKIKSS
jgi:PAS domain S-box-containing protein